MRENARDKAFVWALPRALCIMTEKEGKNT